MFQRLLKRVILPAICGAATFCVATSSVDADWGSHGSWGSSTGASSGGYAYHASSGGSWSSHGSWGSHGSHGSSGGILSRLRDRIRNNIDYRQARRAARRSWYSSGGSSGHYSYYSSGGSWGSSGGSTGGYSSGSHSSGGWGSHGSTGGSVSYSQPAVGQYNTMRVPAPQVAANRDDAILMVSLPEDATVYVNDKLTTTPGDQRRYVSRNLIEGETYTYQVRAEVERNGETLTQTKVVDLVAGAEKEIAFAFDAAAPIESLEPLVTTLRLEVPESAVVRLSGSPTQMTGSNRVFSTTQLQTGESWDDYQIVVEYEDDGKIVTLEESLDLTAGRTYELSFVNPPVTSVASAQ